MKFGMPKFGNIPKPEDKSELIEFVGKDGKKYKMTAEEFAAHTEAEARRKELERKRTQDEGLKGLIESLKKGEMPKKPEDGEEDREDVAA